MLDILIPTHNRREYLQACIVSYMDQTNKNFRIVIYDDGSTDGTEEMVKEFKKVSRFPIIFMRSSVNKGVSNARNHLMNYSQSDYAMWQDSDDLADPRRVEVMLNAIGSTGKDIVFSDLIFFTEGQSIKRSGRRYTIDISKYTSRAGLVNNMAFATAIFNKYVKCFPFDTEKRKREDVKWLVDIMRDNGTFGHVPEALYFVRRHPGRLTYEDKT